MGCVHVAGGSGAAGDCAGCADCSVCRVRNGGPPGHRACGRGRRQRARRRGRSGLRHAWTAPWCRPTATIPSSTPSDPRPARPTRTSHRAGRLSAAHQRHVKPGRAVPGQPDQGREHARDRCALQSDQRRHCRILLRSDHHPDAVQRLSDRKPHPPGRGAGILRPRNPAHDRAEHPAQRRHRLHEPAADRGDPRASAQQRERARSDAAADARPLHRGRGHAHRRRPGGDRASPPGDRSSPSPSRITSPRRRSTSR